MKRLLIGGALAAGLMLSSPLAAQAHETHHKHAAKHSCATQCRHTDGDGQIRSLRPPKTPPPGGWPCKRDHSCASRHHYKPCPPPVKPPKHHKPPVKHHPAPKPPAVHRVPVAAPVPEGLPRTGPADVPVYLLGASVLIGGGGILRRLARVR